MATDNGVPWLPLLAHITEVAPSWGVWKNPDSALHGDGDVDAVAARADFVLLKRRFTSWAVENGFAPVFGCSHIPGVLLLVGVRGNNRLVELDLCDRQAFRGSTLFRATDLTAMMKMDKRGFRRLRPGAEGLLQLVLAGMRHGGRMNAEGLRKKEVALLMKQDPEGAAMASSLFGLAQRQARRLGAAVVAGRWDWLSAIKIEAWSILRGLREIGLVRSRAMFRRGLDRRCALWPVIRAGRTIPGDVDAWISRMERTHNRLDDDAMGPG